MRQRANASFKRGLFLVLLLIVVVSLSLIINFSKDDSSVKEKIEELSVDNGDEKINWNRYAPVNINLTGSYKITKSGVYHLTGNINDGAITIDINKQDVVKLVLDNVTIKNSSGPAIMCLDGEDLVIELIGDNELIDGETYSSISDEDIVGAIYSKADLTFVGDGTLNLKGNFEDGIISKDDLKIKSGTYNIETKDEAIRGKDSLYIAGGTFDIKTGGKGLKSPNYILIEAGTFDINSYDDAIHSDNYIGILNGDISISSGDDGIHADSELKIDGGVITITKSYEALEAKKVTINDGKMTLTASDDGINAGGGADESSFNRIGANHFDADMECILSINGGEVYINAAGDGVDSNGSLYFNGGKVVIDGPTNNGNGALDSGLGIVMNGGEVIAVGSSGMAGNLGQSSRIYSISVFFNEIKPAGTKIAIKDSTGNTVMSHTSAKSFNHLAAGTEEFIPTQKYTIYINNNKYEEFTIANIVTTVGNTYDIMKQRR